MLLLLLLLLLTQQLLLCPLDEWRSVWLFNLTLPVDDDALLLCSSSCIKNTEDDDDEDERFECRPFSLFRWCVCCCSCWCWWWVTLCDWEDSSEDEEDETSNDENDGDEDDDATDATDELDVDKGKLPDDKDRCGCLPVEMLLLALLDCLILTAVFLLLLLLALLLLLLLLLLLVVPLVKPFAAVEPLLRLFTGPVVGHLIVPPPPPLKLTTLELHVADDKRVNDVTYRTGDALAFTFCFFIKYFSLHMSPLAEVLLLDPPFAPTYNKWQDMWHQWDDRKQWNTLTSAATMCICVSVSEGESE